MPEGTQGTPPAHDKFHLELGDLKTKLLELAQAAESAIERSLTALLRRDPDLARQVIPRHIEAKRVDRPTQDWLAPRKLGISQC